MTLRTLPPTGTPTPLARTISSGGIAPVPR
jgi:hypothetical protein